MLSTFSIELLLLQALLELPIKLFYHLSTIFKTSFNHNKIYIFFNLSKKKKHLIQNDFWLLITVNN